ncbi:capsular polysaccharide export protein, LipB/KpsS family [Yoonia litorea]|uniref:Capsular polysaccharide export protein n=1 Tax=Yoonia litorea TaxID=1123755 RepID=A0A1I6LG39_9RHOB|nr:hypothetical protein [Yoonia litorea]SFS02208.1 capsular polysaccharide export protein [Yoonia litorea]
MDETFKFICLDPRKDKRAKITTLLSPLGTLTWRRLPPVRLRNFPETAKRAETALLASKHVPPKGWKRALWLRTLKLQYNGSRALFESNKKAVAVGWNGLNGSRRVFMDAAKDAGVRTLFFELGPFPGRVTVDPHGVNFANALPRDPAPYLAWAKAAGHDAAAWRNLKKHVKQRPPETPPEAGDGLPPLTDPFVFIPLQVPGDSQLRLFGGDFKTVDSFVLALKDAAKSLPTGWHLRLKEHPSTPPIARALLQDASGPIHLDNATDTFAQVAASRGVMTINSSVGLESMFFDKPVVACGQCFWAIDGMAQRATKETLSEVLSAADQWHYDPEVRDAVMLFLSEVYYPDTSSDQDTIRNASIRHRISEPDDPMAWGRPLQQSASS